MTFQIKYGHGGHQQLPEHTEEKESFFDYVRTYWLGRSCGAKHRTTDDKKPVNSSGIVLYPGHRFTESDGPQQVIKHINTKSGPITVISNLERKSYKHPGYV